MHIIFWQNSPSIHQAPFLRALADQPGVRISVICENDVSEKRKSMGWTRPDYGAASVMIQPGEGERQSFLEQNQGKDCTHIFSGFDMTPLNNKTLKSALKRPCRAGVYLEKPDSYPPLKALLRKIKYRVFAQKFRNVDFIFSVGNMATEYYGACGFDKAKLYPFAYFVSADQKQEIATPNESFQFVYVGQNIYRKGVDLLIRALETLPGQNWDLRCIGVSEEAYAQYNVSDSIKSKIHFMGARPNDETKAIMASSDALILPSRFDGWGAVVSEALLAGTKVIVSSEVGAKDLVECETGRGLIFQNRSVPDLQSKMLELLQAGPLKKQDRQAIKDWAQSAIAPETGARYFLACLNRKAGADKPSVPWQTSHKQISKETHLDSAVA